MTDHILKADTYDKQSSKWRKSNSLADLERTHWMLPKYDGCHCIIDTTTCEVWTREMKPVLSMDRQARRVAECLGPGYMVQGEAWAHGREFPAISGDFRRHQQSDLLFMAYNCVGRHEFNMGFDPAPYMDRFAVLAAIKLHGCPDGVFRADYHHQGDWWCAEARATYFVASGGYDGVILADPKAPWTAGRSRNGELIKIKPTLSLDLRCIGVAFNQGAKTGRSVMVLTVTYNGRPVDVGSGVPHSLTEREVLGKIVEIEAMGVTPDGSLREPRFKRIRDDKEVPDA